MRSRIASRLATVLVAVGVALVATPAHASVPMRARVHRRVRARPPARAARVIPRPATATPPAPPVALQLSALEIHVPVARSAVIHAIARDSWPALVRCVTPRPPARGHARVEVHPTEHGVSATVQGPPTHRVATLGTCVRDALSGLNLPPYEGDRPDVLVAFDLAFGMPALGVPARRPHR